MKPLIRLLIKLLKAILLVGGAAAALFLMVAFSGVHDGRVIMAIPFVVLLFLYVLHRFRGRRTNSRSKKSAADDRLAVAWPVVAMIGGGIALALLLILAHAYGYDSKAILAIPFAIILLLYLIHRVRISLEIRKIGKRVNATRLNLELIQERRRRLRAGEPVIQVQDHRLAAGIQSGLPPLETTLANEAAERQESERARRLKPRSLKIYGLIWLALIVNIPIALLGLESFVPSPGYDRLFFLLALLLTLAAIAAIEFYSRRDHWPFVEKIHAKSATVYYLFFVPVSLAFLFLLVWLVLARTIPGGYSALIGVDDMIALKVQKDRGAFRSVRRSFGLQCRYYLKIVPRRTVGFRYCISQDEYEQLPVHALDATLKVMRSSMGYLVYDIQIEGASVE